MNIQKKDNKIRLVLNLVDKVSFLALSDLRLTLLKETQEIESYTVVAGNAVFDNLDFGRYAIKVEHKAEELGVINLEIK